MVCDDLMSWAFQLKLIGLSCCMSIECLMKLWSTLNISLKGHLLAFPVSFMLISNSRRIVPEDAQASRWHHKLIPQILLFPASRNSLVSFSSASTFMSRGIIFVFQWSMVHTEAYANMKIMLFEKLHVHHQYMW